MGMIETDRKLLPEQEAYALLAKYDVEVPEHKFVCSEDEAVIAAEEIGFPVVLKIVSPDAVHKSDIGGVKVNLTNKSELLQAYREIEQSAAANAILAEGMLVSKMISDGIETIIGLGEDKEFGRYIIFGLGGVFVEIFSDVALKVLPIKRKDAEDMIREIKSAGLLTGYRGATPKDTDALVDLLLAVAEMGEKGVAAEMDLNPVLVREKGAVAVDARIYLADE